MVTKKRKSLPRRAVSKLKRIAIEVVSKKASYKSLPDYVNTDSVSKIRKLKKIYQKSSNTGAVLVVPASTLGSIGDDAMLFGLMDRLSKQGFKVDVLDLFNSDADKSRYKKVRKMVEAKVLDFNNVDQLMRLVSNYDRFYFLGADTIDGVYNRVNRLKLLWLAHIAANVNVRATVGGFSFNNTPHPEMVSMINFVSSKIRFCVRDDFSRVRFNKLTNKRGTRVADLAFMMNTKAETDLAKKCIEWIKARKEKGDRVVGINLSNQGKAESGEIMKIEKLYKAEIEALLSSHDDISVVLIHHDNRGTYSDYAVLKKLYADIDDRLKSRVYFLDEFQPYPQGIRSIARELNVAFTGRMHFAIACIGVGTPVASITYQSKFEGMYKYFDLDKKQGLLLELDDVMRQGKIGATVENLLHNENSLRKVIKTHQSSVLNLSENNL